ncbi:MAG: hypothetical protein RIQ62_1746 [Bacteroidota bacterium]
MKIALIGSGNIATFYATRWQAAGHSIVQVISPTEAHAANLANALACPFSTDLLDIVQDADVYLLAVKDDVLLSLQNNQHLHNQFVIHTSGSLPSDLFIDTAAVSACLWPVYSIQKDNLTQIENIPLVASCHQEEAIPQLRLMASAISEEIYTLNDQQKEIAHLAAVFANNFTNHLLGIANELLVGYNIPKKLLEPMTRATIEQAFRMNPFDLKTGPAIRNDEKILQKQGRQLVEHPLWQHIYEAMSTSIQETKKQRNRND